MANFPSYINKNLIKNFIQNALIEDIGPGDYSTLSAIDEQAQGHAELIIKGDGILAGIEVAKQVFSLVDSKLKVDIFKQDGVSINYGDIALTVSGRARSILSSERLVLNILQRMSGIATKTKKLVDLLEGTGAKLLDTRKTTPNFRAFEKWAVKLGGGENHRFALYDMIMLKDNHIDYAGGIKPAVQSAKDYLVKNHLKLNIEVETRNIEEVQQAIDAEADIILLDNMSIDDLSKAVLLVSGRCVTEASGGIDEAIIRSVAETGVDYISVGALTHSYQSLDMSLKASIK